jgi:hypothetical protein
MTDWLARLRSLEKSPDPYSGKLTELTEGAFGGFVSPDAGGSAKFAPSDGRSCEPSWGAFVSSVSAVPCVNAKISPSPWDASDWREYHEERLAIASIDGEESEPEARRIAWECCLTRWRELNPVASDPGRCAHCGRTDEPGNVVPFGIGPHTWLHDRCWPAWDRARQAEAEAVLRPLLGGVENE